MKNPIITITMENGDVMKAELYPEVAPNTVNNFLSLVGKGFYDGLIFHRVIKGFMIQGGCPDGTGMGGPGYTIKGEFSQNGFQNDLRHTPGVLSMARAMHPDSAGSQFFIMHETSPHLDGAYAAFGQIIEGMDVVNKIAEVRTDYSDRPMKEQKIKSMTAETFGGNLSGAGAQLNMTKTCNTEINGQLYQVCISDEPEALLAAKAAGRAVLGVGEACASFCPWDHDSSEKLGRCRGKRTG